MSVKEWEQDVINRQRNIVFPDTVLNQGRFYRNIASGKAVVQYRAAGEPADDCRVFFCRARGEFASTFAGPFSVDPPSFRALDLGAMISLIWLIFWIFLTIKVLFPPPPPVRKRRRGYRSSPKRRS